MFQHLARASGLKCVCVCVVNEDTKKIAQHLWKSARILCSYYRALCIGNWFKRLKSFHCFLLSSIIRFFVMYS